MGIFASYSDALSVAFSNMWVSIITAAPRFVVALVVFSLGLLVAGGLGMIAKKIIRWTKLDTAVEKLAAMMKLQTMGMKLDFAALVGWVVHWFFILVTFIAVADVLHLNQVTDFLRSVVMYLPNVLVALIILAVGLVFAKFIHDVVDRAVKSSHMPSSAAGSLAMIAEWGIIVFTVMAAMSQLGIAARLVEILFSGLVLGSAIAFGLAFGLGGKDKAREWLEKVSRDMNMK